MIRSLCAAFLLAGSMLHADTMVLKDGRTLEWNLIRDVGEAVEVQGPDGKITTVQKKDIKEVRISPPTPVLTGASFTGDTTRGTQPISLMGQIDLKRDVLSGQWRSHGAFLVGTGSPGAHLEITYGPPEEYDVEIVAERTDGDGDLLIGLVGLGRRFSVDIDGPGSATGIRMIDGRYPYENESGVQTRIWPDKKAHRVLCSVRKDRVVASVDGKELVNWKADYARVTVNNSPGALDKKPNLFLALTNGTFKLSKYVLTPRK